MAVPFSNTKLRVPKGFQNILEGIAREVLRSQPDNIFEFGAKYFEQCLRVRDETGHDPAVHGAKLEDRFYNNDSFSSPSVDPSDPQQQDAALSIQTEFRRHSAKKEVESMKEEEAATKIQAGFRGFQDRQKVLEMKDPEEFAKLQNESSDKKPTEGEDEVDIDLNDPEVADAALKIQAGFRGHKARQEMKSMKDTPKDEDQSKSQESKGNEEVDIDLNDPEVANAATKIQAGFRGHKTRQELKDKKKESETSVQEKKQDDIDIDLDDPEVSKAATKIQAGFRGHKTRQEMKAQKESTSETEAAPTTEKTQEEEVDIDLDDPETAKAALKIQAGFRGYQTRKELQNTKSETGQGKSATKEEQSESKGETKEETEESKTGENEEIDIDLNDPEVAKAAEKIQAGFKGYKVRKEMKTDDQTKPGQGEGENSDQAQNEEEEEIDIDLNDPEVEKAAVKIQAGFKGFKARKEVKEQQNESKD